MTNANSQSPALVGSYRRRERRYIPPFGDGSNPNALSNVLDGMLSSCRYAPFPDSKLTDETTLLDITTLACPIEPRFELMIEGVNELSNLLKCQSSDLAVSVSARSPYLRRYELLGSWKLGDLPDGVWRPPAHRLERMQSGRGMDFIVALRVVADRGSLRRQGMDAGKVLARREFSVREETDALSFPFDWVEFGGDTGIPDELLWKIEWMSPVEDEDTYNRPVNEALTVWVNAKAEAKLNALGAVRGSGDLAWKMLASEIVTQIWSDVLRNVAEEPDVSDRETLAGQVFARLSSASGKPYSEIKRMADLEDGDSLSELRGLIAQLLRVVT